MLLIKLTVSQFLLFFFFFGTVAGVSAFSIMTVTFTSTFEIPPPALTLLDYS